jgi:tetratricopeptide (TPR) repeat protein
VVGSIVLAVALGVVSNQRTELANANGLLNAYANELEFAKNESESKRVRAESAVEFLVNALSSPRPDRKGREVTVVEVLDSAFDQIDTYFKDDWVGQILVTQAFADTYQGLGLYRERVEAQKKCYDTLLRERGKFHEETVAALGNLAAAYSEAGMSDQAMPLLKEAVQVLRKTQGANDADTLSAINNLAVACSNNGRDQEAIPYLQEVLQIRMETLGPQHRDTLETLSNLASSYSNIGQLEEALEAYERALKLCEAEFPDDDQLHLGLINNLGMVYIGVHRAEEGRALFDRALESYRARFTEDHPFTLICMNNLGLALMSLERTDEAVPLFEKTLAGKESLLPPDHPSTFNSINNLANAYDYVERYEEAEALHQRSVTVAMQGSSSGQITQQAAIVMGMLARNQFLQGKYQEAEEMCRKALPPLVETAPDDWRSFEAMSILGAALVGQSEFAEAEPLLIDGYEGLAETRSSIPPFAKQRPLEAIKRLIELYESWGKPDKMATWQAKLDKEAG